MRAIAYLIAAVLSLPAFAQTPLFTETFTYPDGTTKLNGWTITSGSLKVTGGTGYTNSSVFRMNTDRTDFRNVELAVKVRNEGFTSTGTGWYGGHIFLRRQSEYHTYYVTFNRADNTAILKKKVPGGSSNGGTYYNLTGNIAYRVPFNVWQDVRAAAKNNADGSVTISLTIDGKLIASATDKGLGGPPITAAGSIGLRGDYDKLRFDDVVVTSLDAAPAPVPSDTTPPLISAVSATGIGTTEATVSWALSEDADGQVEYGQTTSYSSATPIVGARQRNHSIQLSNLLAGRTYDYRVKSRDAAGNLAISGNHTFTTLPAPPPADTTPPTATLTVPEPGAGVAATVHLVASASDDVGVAGVEFRVDGRTIAEDASAPFEAYWDTTTVEDGPHSLTLVARDAAGNAAASEAVSVTVSNAPRYEPPTNAILYEGFAVSDSLVTNEEAYRNPDDLSLPRSGTWDVVGGSLYASLGAGWTGVPSSTNGSAAFRMVSKRSDIGDAAVRVGLRPVQLVSVLPAASADGVYVYLRYRGPGSYYAIGVQRRDGRATITKGLGTTVLAAAEQQLAAKNFILGYDGWDDVTASAVDNQDGSVTISLEVNGQAVLTATDRGVGSPALTGIGKIGLRGDNAEFLFDDLAIVPLAAPASHDAKAPQRFLSPSILDGVNDTATFGTAAEEVSIFDMRGRQVFRASSNGGTITWNARDAAGRVVESGVYIARIQLRDSGEVHQSFVVVK